MYQLLNDTVSYVVFTNPVSSALTDIARKTGYLKPKPTQQATQTMAIQLPLWRIIGNSSYIVRAAGLCGASAVILGAYGAHKNYPQSESKADLRRIFETANRFHFFHSLALLGTPLCRYSKTSALFMAMGMLFFCGTCYYHAFTGDHKYTRLAPVGGMCLILGWLIMIV